MRGATLIDFNAENRSARLSFASETPVRDYWYGKEILRVNDTAMGSERFKAGVMPVLFNHNKTAVLMQILPSMMMIFQKTSCVKLPAAACEACP